MKTRIHKFIILSILSAITFSCSNVEEDLFDEPASIRLENSREAYQKTLEEGPNWLFQYFPHPDQDFGGVNYYLKFKGDKVITKMEGTTDSVTSYYTVLNRGGNVLSFNTYNKLFHIYANPSGSEPSGMEGDFEFLILDQKGDTINLKGRRTGNYMRLIRMKEKPEEYDLKVSKINSYVDKLDLILSGTLAGKDIRVINNHRTLTIGDKKIAYLYTDKSLQFYEPVEIEGKTYSELIFNKESNTLSSIDGNLIINLSYIPIKLSQDEYYIFSQNGISPKLKAQWDKDADAHLARFSGGLPLYPYFTLGRGQMSLFVQFRNRRTAITHSLNFIKSPNSIDNIIIEKGTPDDSWSFLALNSTLNLLVGEFKVEPIDNILLNHKAFRLTSIADPDVWLILIKI